MIFLVAGIAVELKGDFELGQMAAIALVAAADTAGREVLARPHVGVGGAHDHVGAPVEIKIVPGATLSQKGLRYDTAH